MAPFSPIEGGGEPTPPLHSHLTVVAPAPIRGRRPLARRRYAADQVSVDCEKVATVARSISRDAPSIFRQARDEAADGYPRQSIGGDGGGHTPGSHSDPTLGAVLARQATPAVQVAEIIREEVTKALDALERADRAVGGLVPPPAEDTADLETERPIFCAHCTGHGYPDEPIYRGRWCRFCYDWRLMHGLDLPPALEVHAFHERRKTRRVHAV